MISVSNSNNKDSAVQCDICQLWIHIKCNNLNHIDYKYLQGSNDPWSCILCCDETFPFRTLTNKNFLSLANSSPNVDSSFTNNSDTYINKSSSLPLKPSSDLSLLFNQFNNSSPEQRNNLENVVNSNYYDIDQLQTLTFSEKNKSLFLFHMNSCSLSKKFDELQHLLKCTNKSSDIVAISETRIMEKTDLTSNIN